MAEGFLAIGVCQRVSRTAGSAGAAAEKSKQKIKEK